ncbi:MAG: hypothetical protein KJ931_05725 [Candidatus Omnitrophica bacterium]|nr:hypothetical protein [Candidatus Omnitrophota bacterium]MBU4303856.1 hypothetical protein [Candidatus Omnitrophota bacterium]MBU4418349.1 hypothetical protein [Candidatus Omnitrophota bacterium]
MNIKINRVEFWDFIGSKSYKSLTLIELMVSIMMAGMLIVGFYGFETFSNVQMIDSDRRAKVQNNLAYCVEHMSKYVQQANGDINYPPIKLYPDLVTPTGFQVRYDCKSIQTPSDLTDDVWVYYTLSGNNLNVGCKNNLGADCAGSCSKFPAGEELLSNKIVANFNNSIMPANPTDGFYVRVDAQGSLVNIGLVGRYDPTKPVISGTRFTNPQIEVKTKIICNSSSAN